MDRTQTKRIYAGAVPIGEGAPVTVQSMCNTETSDAEATLNQIFLLEAAGCDIVRVAVPDMKSAAALGEICSKSPLPVVADIHFDYRLALEAVKAGVHKIRINPGNIGAPERIKAVAAACREKKIPIRIGINGGSLGKKILAKFGSPSAPAMAQSARENIELLNMFDFDDICLSLKSSDTRLTVDAYRLAADEFPYPLHLGVTEAGTSYNGVIRSAVGIGTLLCEGIGDTVRVSLTADPALEVRAGIAILKAAGLRRGGPEIISCPGCGRCSYDLIKTAEEVESRLSGLKRDITVAVMGCEVNGPGEAKSADYGCACGKLGGIVFRKGEIAARVPAEKLSDVLVEMIESETDRE
ncbi:MAG: flavodoxin-dependent (E)-4-hydroxy-3-methylbut-2-enyl-diphosphate synthase [Oscillospiraceae bacterium]|nr:flavodoxin-dependent (E)-4-hydroxy-3-methylbut-2-enyl-diphosphate synthase [Oscillospiraceae bacterium]